MSHIFKPEFLGGEYPLDTHVRISYKRNYIDEDDWGVCDYWNDGDIFNIEINFPCFKNLQEETGYTGKILDMFYLAICGHEEAHALQISGNFNNLFLWIEKITHKKINKKKSKLWDKLWIPYEEQQYYLENRFMIFKEYAAKMAEISTLVHEGYSRKEILKLIDAETERINLDSNNKEKFIPYKNVISLIK